jgi:hypothetical protein
MRPQIVAMGLADERELDQLDAAARDHFADPDTAVMPSLTDRRAGPDQPG